MRVGGLKKMQPEEKTQHTSMHKHCKVYAFQSSSTCNLLNDLHVDVPADGDIRPLPRLPFLRDLSESHKSSLRISGTRGLEVKTHWVGVTPRMTLFQAKWVTNKWSKNTAMTRPCCQLAQDPDPSEIKPKHNQGNFQSPPIS